MCLTPFPFFLFLGSPQAIKFIREAVARAVREADVSASFTELACLAAAVSREAAAAGRPHLLPILAVCRGDIARLCLVQPLAAGGSLADALARPGALPVGRQRVTAALHAALGLSALHSRHPRLLHRDIKPENVVFDAAGRAYVTDYVINSAVVDDDGYDESGMSRSHYPNYSHNFGFPRATERCHVHHKYGANHLLLFYYRRRPTFSGSYRESFGAYGTPGYRAPEAHESHLHSVKVCCL